jgi:hypothetical protein
VDSDDNVTGVEINCTGPERSCAKQVGGPGNFFSQFVLNRVNLTRIAMGGNGVYVTQDNYAADATSIDLTLVRVGDTKGNVTSIAYGAGDNPIALIAGAVATNSAGEALVDDFSERLRHQPATESDHRCRQRLEWQSDGLARVRAGPSKPVGGLTGALRDLTTEQRTRVRQTVLTVCRLLLLGRARLAARRGLLSALLCRGLLAHALVLALTCRGSTTLILP